MVSSAAWGSTLAKLVVALTPRRSIAQFEKLPVWSLAQGWTAQLDGKGKGWLSVGWMSLKRLRFLDPAGHPLLALEAESLMISVCRAPSVYPTATQSPPLLVLPQYDNYIL